MDSVAVFAGLSAAEQAELLSRHFAAKARQLRRADAAPPALYRTYALGGASSDGVHLDLEAAEDGMVSPAATLAAEAEEEQAPVAAAAALPVDPAILAPAPAGEAAPAEKHRIITPKTILAVAENAAELVERVRNGEITVPLWGTAMYVKDWRAGKRGDPALALPSAIRQAIRNGINTKKMLQEELGWPMKDIDAQVREMSKMGLILF